MIDINNINDLFIERLIQIACRAGDKIMEIYHTDFDIYTKEDKSPVTEADKIANAMIESRLDEMTPKIPILSEEGIDIDYKVRSNWNQYWLVDPLDGTKEFIKKNDEFTVNIALIDNCLPVLGVVYAPALNLLYWGSSAKNSYKLAGGNKKIINVLSKINEPVEIAVSRSHLSNSVNKILSKFNNYNLHPMGSSLKICSVSSGDVHFYPRMGPTMEWDTAASHAIIKGAGGELVNIKTNKPLIYNKKNLLNDGFVAAHLNIIDSLLLLK